MTLLYFGFDREAINEDSQAVEPDTALVLKLLSLIQLWYSSC